MRILVLFFLILSACATRFDPSVEYGEKLKTPPPYSSSRTVVLFLVDGLSFQMLDPQLRHGHLTQIQKHFLSYENARVYQARSVFPSLTFPAIASLLKGAPVNQTGALGNTLLYDGKVTSFESVKDRPKFTEMMKGNNIFTRLNEKRQRSVSLDYGLAPDATVSSSNADLKIGVAATLEDYLYLDQKKLASLQLILSKNPPHQWPEFIFIHLVGLDFLSHHYGPRSNEAIEYLEKLDSSLAEVFRLLRAGESKSHQVISMLTADHGFSPTAKKSVDFEKELKSLKADLHGFNEHRMASVYAAKPASREELQRWSKQLLQKPGIEITATRYGNTVEVKSRTQSAAFTYVPAICPYGSLGVRFDEGLVRCPGQFGVVQTPKGEPLFYPYFLENLAYYFQAEKHPDLIVIPEPDVVFAKNAGGFHGGPTADELMVPLLMRGGVLANPMSPPPLWDLLNVLR